MSVAAANDDAQLLALRKEREEFEARVRENERLAAADPPAYQRKLRRLVALGYAFIGLMLALAFGLIAGIVTLMATGNSVSAGGIKLIIVALALLYAILRSLWVKIDRPEGFLLTKERYPKLWAEVDSIAERLKAPRPDEIRLDEDFNASATQWPRSGTISF